MSTNHDAYQYTRSFRLKLLALLLDVSWVSSYGLAIIKPEYFEQEDEECIARAIIDYRQHFKSVPRDPDDLATMLDGKYWDTISAIYDGKDWWSLDLAREKAIEFAKEQAAKLAVLDSLDDIERGDLGSVVARVKDAAKLGDAVVSPGIDPIRDVEQWLYDDQTNHVPTGWTHIDRLLRGGISAGELGLILGAANRGKTMGLINVGYSVASIMYGKDVVHFTHEMSAAKIAKRYAARMVFKFPSGDIDEDYEASLAKAARRLVKGRIRVIDGCNTVAQIEAALERLKGEGFDLGVIIDDYPDLVEPPARYSERRFELSYLYRWFRELGKEYNCPVWAATQSNRGGYNKEIVTMDDVSEDIGKATIADVIIAICQTRDERASDLCRLFMAKVRDSKSQDIFRAKYYGHSQSIITIEEVKGKQTNA